MSEIVEEKQAKAIAIGKRYIGPGHPVLVIAEIGINHEGDLEVCARMIEEAAKAGADAIKLQSNDPGESYAPDTESFALFSRAMLSPENTAKMFDLARSLHLEAFTTPGDMATLEWVEKLNPSAYKVSSGLLDHHYLIKAEARTGRSVLLSTGMSRPGEAAAALEAARSAGGEQLCLFLCTSIYPAPPETLNLSAIARMQREHCIPIGFSDHSLGSEAAALSVAAGAMVIEKHFSLDPSRAGFDHPLSVDPESLSELVARVKAAETMLGSSDKPLSPDERENAAKLRRCLAARQDIPAGRVLTEDDVCVMRMVPEKSGLPPMMFESVLGRIAKREMACFEPIDVADVEAD